jgi:hypothetical protein
VLVCVLVGPFSPGAVPGGQNQPPIWRQIAVIAVEFCRTLAGRAPAVGLLTTIVPF